MIKNIVIILILLCIFIAIIKLQIFLAKKDKKILGLIMPISIFCLSIVLAFGAIPVKQEIQTSQMAVSKTGQVLTDILNTNISTFIIDKSLALTSIIYTILIINLINVVMLSIYFYYRHQKRLQIELKRMKNNELY